MSYQHKSYGFTLVELVIVVVVIAAILTILISILRDRERQRLQAIADAEPWEVFEFRAEPTKESFAENEEIVVQCEMLNSTGYPLTLPKDLDYFHLIFGDENYIAGISRLLDPVFETTLAPGESASFDLSFPPRWTGADEFRIVYYEGKAQVRIGVQRNVNDEFEPFVAFILPTAEKHFQSHAFKLVVKKSDKSQLPKFVEFVGVRILERYDMSNHPNRESNASGANEGRVR